MWSTLRLTIIFCLDALIHLFITPRPHFTSLTLLTPTRWIRTPKTTLRPTLTTGLSFYLAVGLGPKQYFPFLHLKVREFLCTERFSGVEGIAVEFFGILFWLR